MRCLRTIGEEQNWAILGNIELDDTGEEIWHHMKTLSRTLGFGVNIETMNISYFWELAHTERKM